MRVYLEIFPICSRVFGVESEGGGDGARDPVDHDVVQQLVQGELLGEVAVGKVPVVAIRPKLFYLKTAKRPKFFV